MKKLFFLLIIIGFSYELSAQGIDYAKDQFSLGNDAYMKGDYETALNHFLEAEPNTEGLAINYNLGNAYFKLGQIPECILHYERALRFDPSNEDVQYNLSIANDLIVDKIEVLPKSKFQIWWRTFRYSLGPDGWAKLCIALALVAVLLFLLYYFSHSTNVRRLAFFGGLIGFLLLVFAYTLAVSAENYRYAEKSAIIFTDKVDVKSEPRGGSVNVFVLHAGTKVDILSREGEWYEVKIASGAQGWIYQDELKLV
ncbi:MAG: tetratricopeptide repeat protein [Flavobacteriales bacterium]|nr:tetratricopeptide repeat protein [Flavobacteriales bacterium]